MTTTAISMTHNARREGEPNLSKEVTLPDVAGTFTVSNGVAVTTLSTTELYSKGYGTIKAIASPEGMVEKVLVLEPTVVIDKRELDARIQKARANIENSRVGDPRPFNRVEIKLPDQEKPLPVLYHPVTQKNKPSKLGYYAGGTAVSLLLLAGACNFINNARAQDAADSQSGQPTAALVDETPTPTAKETPAKTTATPVIIPTKTVLNENLMALCPAPDGSIAHIPILAPDTITLPESAWEINQSTDPDMANDYIKAVEKLNLGPTKLPVCSFSKEDGVSDVLIVYNIDGAKRDASGRFIVEIDLNNRDVVAYYMWDDTKKEFININDDQVYSADTKYLHEGLVNGQFRANHYLHVDEKNPQNSVDAVVLSDVNGYIYGLISADKNGKPVALTPIQMLRDFGQQLVKTPQAWTPLELPPEALDAKNSFGYELGENREGQDVLVFTVRDRNGVLIYNINLEESDVVNETSDISDQFSSLLEAKELKDKVDYIGIGIDSKTPIKDAIAVNKDGSGFWIFTDDQKDIRMIPLEEKVRSEKITWDSDTEQYTDGIFWFDDNNSVYEMYGFNIKGSGEWLSSPGKHIPSGELWEKNREEILLAWIDSLKFEGFSETEQNFIKNSLRKRIGEFNQDTSIPDYVISQDPNIRNFKLMQGDPTRFWPLVNVISFGSGTGAAEWQDRHRGRILLNPDGVMGEWDNEFRPYFIPRTILKEGAVHGMFLLAQGSPFTLVHTPDKRPTGKEIGTIGRLTPLEDEWGSNIPSILAIQGLLKISAVKNNQKLFDGFSFLLDSHYTSLYKHPLRLIGR